MTGKKSVIEEYTHFSKLDRIVADEFIDLVEVGMADNNGERDIHIHWKL